MNSFTENCRRSLQVPQEVIMTGMSSSKAAYDGQRSDSREGEDTVWGGNINWTVPSGNRSAFCYRRNFWQYCLHQQSSSWTNMSRILAEACNLKCYKSFLWNAQTWKAHTCYMCRKIPFTCSTKPHSCLGIVDGLELHLLADSSLFWYLQNYILEICSSLSLCLFNSLWKLDCVYFSHASDFFWKLLCCLLWSVE